MKNILDYFLHAASVTKKVGPCDVVLATSQPPILGGLLGVWGKWITKGKLVYNIQDFNPEQIMAVGYLKNKFILKLLMALDKFVCRRSDLIITIGRDMQKTLEARFAGKRVPKSVIINNWIDEKAVYPLSKDHPEIQAFREKYGLADKFVVMYSGNIGLYYDLQNLVKLYGEYKDRADVAFAFVGDGAVKKEIEEYCRENGLANVVFIPYQDKDKLVYGLNAADVHIVNNAKGIKGVSVPSKIYGVLAANVPILGILEPGSEAWSIIEDSGCGILAEAGDYDAIRKALDRIVIEKEAFVKAHETGRTYLEARFMREKSIGAYGEAIAGLCAEPDATSRSVQA